MNARRTNWGVTAAALALLLACLAVSDLIPQRDGIGYDGFYYHLWVRHLTLDVLFEEVRERPPFVEITTYKVRRVLVPMLLHYFFRVADLAVSPSNIIEAFRWLNLLCLGLATYWFCRCADRLGIGSGAKWLGGIALILNHANSKIAFYNPVLVDTAAMAAGTGILLLYLSRFAWALVPAVVASGFVWPTFPYFGALLIAFPLRDDRSTQPAAAPKHLDRFVADAAALLGFVIIVGLMFTDHSIWTTPIEPIRLLLPFSAALVVAHLHFGIRPLLDSSEVWDDLRPDRLIRSGTVWVAVLSLVVGQLIVLSIPQAPDEMGSTRAVTDTFFTAITQPGVNWVAHALHFGPLVLLLPFLWRPVSESVRRCGTGLVLCFVLVVVLGVGSESRRLMNVYPLVALFLVQAATAVVDTRGRWIAVIVLSLVLSKVWLPMSAPLNVPGLGEIPWRVLFDSSRGPWIDHGWWAAQGVAALAVAACFYVWSRPRISSMR